VAADLLVERVEQLLAGGCPGEGRALVERAPEAAEVEQALVVRLKGTPMRSSRSMMAGARAVMSRTGVWLARKSPP